MMVPIHYGNTIYSERDFVVVGLFVSNGISMSPQLEWKFKTQDEDPVNGSNLSHTVFGNNATRQLK